MCPPRVFFKYGTTWEFNHVVPGAGPPSVMHQGDYTRCPTSFIVTNFVSCIKALDIKGCSGYICPEIMFRYS